MAVVASMQSDGLQTGAILTWPAGPHNLNNARNITLHAGLTGVKCVLPQGAYLST